MPDPFRPLRADFDLFCEAMYWGYLESHCRKVLKEDPQDAEALELRDIAREISDEHLERIPEDRLGHCRTWWQISFHNAQPAIYYA
jgi:hypothetical protein